jgi:hypothetical protein
LPRCGGDGLRVGLLAEVAQIELFVLRPHLTSLRSDRG